MSGPPELPGLIGASVCRTPSISKLLGAWMVRWTAEMTPVVSVRSEPEGIADGDDRIADLDGPRGAERQRRELEAGRVDLQQREVGGLVLAEDLGVDALLVGELDRDLRGAVDHVGVGEDGAGLVDDEARARGLALLLLGQPEVEWR